MDLKKKQKELLSALDNAYKQQVKALNEKLDPKEVDPEKRKTALALYRQAADDAESILAQMLQLDALLENKPEQEAKKAFFGVEDILEKR